MPGPRDPDDRLVRRVRDGDPAAFGDVHRRYAAPLEAYARRILGEHRAAAEDVVQEAFLRTHRILVRQPGRPIALRPWLYAVVRNAALDELRGDHRGRVDLADAAGGADPAAVATSRAALRDLLGRIAGLPDRQRSALLQHAVGGLAHEDVARNLGTSTGASRLLVHRARAALTAAGPR
ncbi:RNA polymerase sigma factor [Baekduia soli]|nr:RNA polymerase sigma factor [Baekduia soli]